MTVGEIEICEVTASSCQLFKTTTSSDVDNVNEKVRTLVLTSGLSPGDKLTCHYAYVLLRWYVTIPNCSCHDSRKFDE